MKENKQRSMILIIITITTLALVVGMATYAYFATSKDLNGAINANVGTAASMYSFSASSNSNIEMNIAFNEMSEANVSQNVLKTDNATIDISLASPTNDMKTTCTYDIVWVWDDGDIYDEPDVDSLSYTHTDNKVYPYEFSAKVDANSEEDLSKLPTSSDGKTITLAKNISIKSSSTTPTPKTHIIEANIYNLPVEQTKLFNKSFRAHITIDNLNCNMKSNEPPYHTTCNDDSAACTIAKLYTADGVNGLYYHDGEGNYTNADLEIGDNSYRYSGANPKNYVCFSEDVDEETGKCANNNLYRIIGVIDGKVKLIKYTNDGNKAWNEDGDNTWSTSTLAAYLNNDQEGGYLNKLGTTKVNLIDDTIWSVGGFKSSNLSSQNAQGIYNIEINPETKTPYPGKIGLMYVSEYMYAAEPTYWDHVAENNATNGYNLSLNHDWMWSSGYPWTISRNSDNSFNAFNVINFGYVNFYSVDDDSDAVRPSFSLKSSTMITIPTGEDAGSINKPYIITGKSASTGEKLAMYWNNNFEYVEYIHPNTPSTTYESVAALQEGYNYFASRPIYIKTTEEKHEACLYYNNKEFCLGANYFETDGSTTKGKLQTEMATSFEIEESSLSCISRAHEAYCNVGAFRCGAHSYGVVSCDGDVSACVVDVDGIAYCY